jgi:hypothetical protein
VPRGGGGGGAQLHPEGGKPLKTKHQAEAMRVFVLSVADACIAVDKSVPALSHARCCRGACVFSTTRTLFSIVGI